MTIKLDDAGWLHCPTCGLSYTRATGVAEAYDSRPPERRISWRIQMYCEAGCQFDLVIEQAKGNTTLSAVSRPDRFVVGQS